MLSWSYSKGLVNTGGKFLSGQNNVLNKKFIVTPKSKIFKISNGDGSVQFYNIITKEKTAKYRYLTLDKKLNRTQLKYSYLDNFKFKGIASSNQSGKLFGNVTFNYYKQLLKLHSSQDGREVGYHFNKWKIDRKGHKKYLLSKVERPNAPDETFQYHYKSMRISRKDWGTENNPRFLKTEYVKVKLKGLKTGTHWRVYNLNSPVGTDSTPIKTHTFYYDDNYTTVKDAYNNLTNYTYSNDLRLTTVTKRKFNKRYSRERLFWGEGNQKTFLKARSFEDMKRNIKFCRTFQYDSFGNVLKDRLYGKITGLNNTPISQDKKGNPSGSEFFEKRYTYSKDGKNLMLSESDDRKNISYSYVSGTNLLTKKLIKSGNEIKIREFNEYNEDGVVIKKIIDNGSKENANDLTNVTERKIQYIQTTKSYPIGLPEIVVDKYLKNGEEKLLKKTVNRYSKLGNLIEQEHYDSNESLRYTLYWEYNNYGNVTKEIDALGQTTIKTYDEFSNLIKEVLPGNIIKEYEYDFSDRLISEKHFLENGEVLVKSYLYDYKSNKIASFDEYGNETKYVYDAFGRCIKTIYPTIFDKNDTPFQPEETTTYNHLSHPVTKTSPRGFTVETEFNIHGKPLVVKHADGSEELNTYYLDDLVKTSTNKSGLTTHYTYDYLSRPIKKEIYSNQGTLLYTTTREYDAFHLLSETDANGIKTTYNYDAAGRLIEEKKGLERTCFRYDALGRKKATIKYDTENSFIETSQEYDLLNRVISQTVETNAGDLQKYVLYSYDERGNCIQTTRFTEHGESISSTKYDALNRVIEEIDPEGNIKTINYRYDYINEYGQIVSCKEIIDAKGNVTQIISDTLGHERSVYKKNLLGQPLQKRDFIYDESGNKTHAIDTVYVSKEKKREVVTQWVYDCENRITQIIEALGTTIQKVTEERYDQLGQKISTIKPDGTEIVYSYNEQGLLSSYKASNNSFHYKYTYDTNHNPIRVDDLVHNRSTIKEYDDNNRLIKESLANGLTVEYTYDHIGRPLKVIYPDKTASEYVYDGSFLKEVKRNNYSYHYNRYDQSGNILETNMINNIGLCHFSYDLNGRNKSIKTPFYNQDITSYDEMGNIRQRVIDDQLGTVNCDYEYDDLYQLTQEKGVKDHTYTNDSLYNRVHKDKNSYTVNALNQVTHDGVFDYSYDTNGNRSKKSNKEEEITYEYDSLDRLIKVKYTHTEYLYTYDELNRRLTKESKYSDGTTQTVRYLYQGQNEVGSVDENGKIIELRVLGTGLGAEIGATIAIEIANNTYSPIHDHNGNIVALIDENKQVKEHYRFTSFGEEEVFSDTTPINPWRFSSKRVDPETGHVNFGRRYYDPNLGKWISPDPAGFEAGPNLYAYVNNNPLTHFDLYGLMDSAHTPTIQHSMLCKFRTFTGGFIRMLGDHLIPIPVVRNVVSVFGHLAMGGSLSNYKNTYGGEKSGNYHLHEEENYSHKNFSISFINGILNCLDAVHFSVNEMSKLINKLDIKFTHSASNGLIFDLIECLALKMGIKTASVDQLINSIRAEIAEVGGVNSGNEIYQFAHSRGGLVLAEALKYLTPEEKQMINVRTFGSARLIADKDLKSVTNYVSTRDPIPFIGDPIGYMKARFGNDTNTQFIHRKGFPNDHGLKEAYGEFVKTELFMIATKFNIKI